MMIDIYPAIDLKDGKAVRLYKGDMQSAKVYGEALAFAQEIEAMGAKWLHIVDLNGAFAGEPRNKEVIKQILSHTSLKIELGGGIRTQENIAYYQDLGVERIILGSIALQDPEFALKMAQHYKIAIGIDARNGKVATQGWAKEEDMEASVFASYFKGSKVDAIICTDINRDGALSGINIEFTQNIAQASGIYTIASGGFSDAAELEILSANPHIRGVIIGKAFYEHKIDLQKYMKNT
ncbi:1-(5-phosphoribosyl)-5-[(5-phosphoribosylamino)methylideneamino]imidazole-4-carboxamide isomerase [Helicobacter sp. TUL]|uniref:1-(5-phosphoribosyl)-5-[(5- phosphoribosylamino)methylideneamino]imidazole-4- carboxamide isomerase n=1 Tax=Helicobacter sp. TUL TaxID=1848928 RepID=UPI000BAB858F|nr:1-(5-phosphoribosyl)-5-[(5-phosphoribosylamino)methylideneamino]imidazole-4-carboxamide isomerase [Helicobacter sp. TUL]PAV00755.1 1-(5-phosphoribosyl)-5-[(5-phosphoribosylamino)methylideneamino]imidazole-4-carboxamide isomerase [Helicobacter sp. TUL]